MRNVIRVVTLALAVAALGGATAVPVAAEERSCRGTIGARTLDNVRVPQGATCTLQGTFLKGTVKVERNATLFARGVRVIGNVQGENARNVVVSGSSRIGGSVQVVQGRRARVVDSRVSGEIQLKENSGMLSVRRNVVGGDVQVFENDGGAAIYRNRIDGNLQCKENRPRPVGGGNVVEGNKEDQCRRF